MKVNAMTHAVAVAVALGLNPHNDGKTIEELKEKLLTLNENVKNIQAKADAEKRELNEQESKDVAGIFAEFESVEADIERRERIAAMSAKVNAPAARRTQTDGLETVNAKTEERKPAAAPAARTPRIEAIDDRKTWGFRNFGDYARSVMAAASIQRGGGGAVDPRLVANAPSSFGQEGSGADGGFAVPPEFRQAIMVKVMAEDSLLSRTDQQTSSSNSFTFPKDETTPWQTSGGIQASWEGESSQLSQSKPNLQNTTVKLNKLTALVPVTDELLEDAASLSNYLNTKAPAKIDFKINDAIINGTGAGQPLGFLNSGALVTVAKESGQAAATVNFANITKMWARMYSQCRKNSIWLINQDVEQQLPSLVITGSNSGVFPAYLPPGCLSSSPYGQLMGRPVVVTEACQQLGTAGDINLVDLSTYMTIVKAGGIRADVSIHLWFDYDITAFRFVMRVGGQPWWTSAITRKNGSNKLSCFVNLAAR